MTNNVEALLNQLKDKSYKAFRTKSDRFPVLYPVDVFGFNIGNNERFNGDDGGNVTPNYKRVMEKGFDAIRQEIVDSIEKASDEDKKAYGRLMLQSLDNMLEISDKYRETVKENERLYNALKTVPRKPASSFFEACLMLKICIYFLRISKVGHIGLGRFDQYMYSYYLSDKEKGITDSEIFENIEAFFISLNFDSDLYSGVQQGDNGQSMVLGGYDLQNNSQYNELTDMCLDASLELNLIDPKINLRVSKNTPDEVFIKATHLTKQGLGFPQYCNDDVVIPGLIKLGYEPEDAANYVVAACWEYIIPNCGADVPNKHTMNFPMVVNKTVHEKLSSCKNFDELMQFVKEDIKAECDSMIDSYYSNQPFLSIMTDGCIENLADIWSGCAKYNNFGCHGPGIANAADSLCAIKTCVFEDKTISAKTLLDALNNNFEGFCEERNLLRGCSKMGNNEDNVDSIAIELMTAFSKNLNNRENGKGGIWRAGTGSAMEYILSARNCPATADGRKATEPYPSSFSPSLDVKTNGLLSIIQSFTKYDMTEIINGGPLTLEIHDTVFRNDIGIEKTAKLVKLFIEMGGHQLQLNSINRERLLDAQKNPQNYPNLIVRVWGWSGYFNELDLEYQNHIIRRTEYLR